MIFMMLRCTDRSGSVRHAVAVADARASVRLVSKHVVITGASGLVGTALSRALLERGWTVVGASRDPARSAASGPEGMRWVALEGADLEAAILEAGKVINLAGQEPFARKLDTTFKELVRSSRVDITKRVAAILARSTAADRVLVNASGTVIYGDHGDTSIDESAPFADDFMASFHKEWEAAALSAEQSGVRVAVLRVGTPVLGRGKGGLADLERLFKLRMGPIIGTGRQYIAWVALSDLVELFITALEDDRYRGAFNACSPKPVMFRDLARAMGRSLGRSAWLRIPGFMFRWRVGEAATLMLNSSRSMPTRAQALGFRFALEDVTAAFDAMYTKAQLSATAASR
jgi:uncharacterized protein (TIGR01777 family)